MHDPRPVVRRVAAIVVLVLVLAACGSDPSIVSSAGETGDGSVPAQSGSGDGAGDGSDATESDPGEVPTTPPVELDDQDPATPDVPAADEPDEPVQSDDGETPDAPPSAEPVDPDTAVTSPPLPPAEPDDIPSDTGWQRIDPMPDLLDPRPVQPEELLVTPDGRTVLVRFWNGVEPCSGARVTVTERSDSVEVLLETGANANAATMVCIALAAAYEIAVPLADPLGDRQLVAVVPPLAEPPTDDPFDDAVFPVEQYLGLTLEEAEALAIVEQRPFRIGRLDDEWFALTEDFVPQRVTVEVEAGVVVAAVGG